jgi:DNA invertase Pin-like site-specific DNA recombinase
MADEASGQRTAARRRERAMRSVLVGLALTSNGRTASWAPTGRSAGSEVAAPRLGAHDAPHLFHAREWERAGDDPDRQQAALEAAQRELERIRRSPAPRRVPEESAEDLAARIVRTGAGFPAREVAIACRTSQHVVRRARREAGRDEDLGLAPRGQLEPQATLTADERRAEALRLEAQGVTPRQIALLVGASVSTVLRDLGRKR